VLEPRFPDAANTTTPASTKCFSATAIAGSAASQLPE
jgi:hypothetical protein